MEAANPDFEQAVRRVVLSMPAAKHLGFDFSRVEPGEVELIAPYRPELTQHDGFFQGGVIGSLIDFAGGSAAGTLLPPGWLNMIIDYTVKILAPARGDKLIVSGRVLKAGSTITVASADVFASTGTESTLCATGLVTMRNIRLTRS
jgi:uncharacterized protein (TIGR00369 family)